MALFRIMKARATRVTVEARMLRLLFAPDNSRSLRFDKEPQDDAHGIALRRFLVSISPLWLAQSAPRFAENQYFSLQLFYQASAAYPRKLRAANFAS